MNEPTTYSQTRWTREIDRMLKHATDVSASMRYGISRSAIRQRRTELGFVRPPASSPKFSKKQEKRLGTLPDTEFSTEIGIDAYWVRKRRIELGIPAYEIPLASATTPHPEMHQWTAKQDSWLGTQPDTIIAERIGLSPSSVTMHRRALGIEPFRRGGDIEWTEGMLRLLGEVPDGTLAREYDISASSVKVRRIMEGIPPYGQEEMDSDPDLTLDVIHQIGQLTDQRLHQVYGVSRHKIRIYRALHGIPAADYRPAPNHHWMPADEELLGTMSDRRVAAKIGLTANQVMYRRKKLGIPPPGMNTTIRWTKDRIEMLGTLPDSVLARQWNVSQHVIREHRDKLGIERCERTKQQCPD